MWRSGLDAENGVVGLPLIRNAKPGGPGRREFPRVIQMESAMGRCREVLRGIVLDRGTA